jgi:hypothetical protein
MLAEPAIVVTTGHTENYAKLEGYDISPVNAARLSRISHEGSGSLSRSGTDIGARTVGTGPID